MAETARKEGDAALENARCAVHADAVAVGVCARCGDYHCAACHKRIGGRALCATCRKLPGVDYIDETRARYWGKRDGFVWYFGLLGGLGGIAALLTQSRGSDALTLLSQVLSLAMSIAYLALYRPARTGMVAVTVFGALVAVVNFVRGTVPVAVRSVALPPSGLLGLSLGGSSIVVLLLLAAYYSPRNKLAFKIAIPDVELQRVYDTYVSNPLALRAAWYSAILLFLPFANIITLLVAIRAHRRADPGLWPPRGGRRAATIGIAVSTFGLLFWSVFIASVMFGHK